MSRTGTSRAASPTAAPTGSVPARRVATGGLGPLTGRIAAAPISWGICEVPGWGVMLPPERVLGEMAALGLTATELGAAGFLPQDPSALRELLDRFDLGLIAGFVPLVLHDPAQWPAALRLAEQAAHLLAAGGATIFVTALVQDETWSRPVPVGRAGMSVVAQGLTQVDEVCARYGLTQVLHPHVDTLIETARDVELALECTDVAWCLDTGHLRTGGVDPVRFAADHAARIKHVHLKDVASGVAARVLGRDLTLADGVKAGMFPPLGEGDVAVDEVVRTLEAQGYQGWYVLEQDTALSSLPAVGQGPVEDVARCLDHLRTAVVPRLSHTARTGPERTT